MNRLKRADIQLGRPLPFSVYDAKGVLLLRRGFVITIEEQVDRLIDRGLFAGDDTSASDPGRPAPIPVYQRIGAAALRLKALATDLHTDQPSADSVGRLNELARDLLDALAQDPDAALAALHLDFHNHYLLAHQVHCAALAGVLARRLEIGVAETLTLVGAALTQDLGMIDFNYLEKTPGQLEEQHRSRMGGHPHASARMLGKAGIRDPLWLDAVRDHHERLDGSGYPAGKPGEDIGRLARILAVADVYTAMIKPRAWRAAKVPLTAMQELFAKKGAQFSADICNALVKELGMYPPGSLVRLASEEVAVVSRRTGDIQKPEIRSVYERQGLPRMTPLLRDARDPAFAIQSAVSHAECQGASLIIPRIWTGS